MKIESGQTGCMEPRAISASRGGRAFTLVELLVVVGIIAIMIAFLMPALNKARKSAQQVKCASNLKGIYLGVAMYANAYNGKYPHQTASFPMASGSYGSGWPQRLIHGGYMGPCLMPNEATAGSGDWDRAFKPKMLTVFSCPVPLANKTVDERTGHYAINTEVYEASDPDYYLRATQVKVPARYILLGENRDVPGAGNTGLDRPDIAQPTRHRRRHNDGGNFAYADGHVEWHHHKEFVKQMNTWGVTAWPYYDPNKRLPFRNTDK
jgi:prepilin-type processing-associated H-X9-DG protein/prepilin-type N-terminal cleavage/methylation domain-containing protein